MINFDNALKEPAPISLSSLQPGITFEKDGEYYLSCGSQAHGFAVNLRNGRKKFLSEFREEEIYHVEIIVSKVLRK